MKKTRLLFLLALPLSLFAQTQEDFLTSMSGLWKQISQEEEIEENYFKFTNSGDFSVSVNTGTPQEAHLVEAVYGKITVLNVDKANSIMVEIMLNDEYSTNLINVENNELVIYSFDEKTNEPFKKLLMKKLS